MKVKYYLFLVFVNTIMIMDTKNIHAQDCLFKNPLCFYNSDILTYLQVLHKNQQYEQMLPYLCGPAIDNLNMQQKITRLEDVQFGYQMKRAGVKEISKSEWNLTYSRTIMGTQENFKIRCLLKQDKCCLYLDEKAWKVIFK